MIVEVEAAKPEEAKRACVLCNATKESGRILITITPQFYASYDGERFQRMGKGVTVCQVCLGAVVGGSTLKAIGLGNALKENLANGYNAIAGTFKPVCQ